MTDSVLARHAVRSFKKDKLFSDEADQLIAAFQAAPCGMGQADVTQAVVIESDDMLQRFEKSVNDAAYGAPLLFVIATKADSQFGERNASVAAENVMVEATRLGLGSVYVMSAAMALQKDPDLIADLGIDDGYTPQVVVPVGHATEEIAANDRSDRYKVTRR